MYLSIVKSKHGPTNDRRVSNSAHHFISDAPSRCCAGNITGSVDSDCTDGIVGPKWHRQQFRFIYQQQVHKSHFRPEILETLMARLFFFSNINNL